MKHISTRQFRILCDPMAVYQFMTEIYEKDWRNGVPAPFYEYALSSGWMDKSYTYLNRLCFDGDQIVGFVFTENPVTDIYFSLRPGYEMLAEEMVAYAHEKCLILITTGSLSYFRGRPPLPKRLPHTDIKKSPSERICNSIFPGN